MPTVCPWPPWGLPLPDTMELEYSVRPATPSPIAGVFFGSNQLARGSGGLPILYVSPAVREQRGSSAGSLEAIHTLASHTLLKSKLVG